MKNLICNVLMTTKYSKNNLCNCILIRTLSALILLSLVFPIPYSQAIELLELQDPSDSGTPTGNPYPGTTRPEFSCPDTNQKLTALFENRGRDYTQYPQPTFWFYVPYSQEEIKEIRLIIWDETESEVLFEGQPAIISGDAGFRGFTLPENFSLTEGELYRWYLLLSCIDNQSGEPDQVVDGWIEYNPKPATNEDLRIFLYDSINVVARSYYEYPNIYLNEWFLILDYLGIRDLVDSSVHEPVLLNESKQL